MKVFLLIFLSFLGLINFCHDSLEKDILTSAMQDSIISKALYKELQSFISYTDSLNKFKNYTDTEIIFVSFDQQNEECYLLLGVAESFNRDLMTGYLLTKKKMITFYNPINCVYKMVDFDKLQKQVPKKLENKEQSKSDQNIFDPWGRKFKIHNNDSLELIYQGMF